jgi:hypothetical protein
MAEFGCIDHAYLIQAVQILERFPYRVSWIIEVIARYGLEDRSSNLYGH